MKIVFAWRNTRHHSQRSFEGKAPFIVIARIPFRFQHCARIGMFDGGYGAPPYEKKRFNEM